MEQQQQVSMADVGEAQETEPVVESVEAEETPEAPAAEDQPTEDKPETPEKPKVDKTAKYINKLRDQRSRLEGENAALRRQIEQQKLQSEAPAGPEGEPTREQFETDAEYFKAVTRFEIAKAKEELKRETVEVQTQSTWGAKLESARAEYTDWDEVLEDARNVEIPKEMQDAITSSAFGPDILYKLAKDTSEASRLAKLPPVAMAREIGRIEAQIEYAKKKPEPEVVRVSKAPAPPKPVKANASVEKDPDKMTTKEWLDWRNKQLKEKRM